jgi:hypothetical protein
MLVACDEIMTLGPQKYFKNAGLLWKKWGVPRPRAPPSKVVASKQAEYSHGLRPSEPHNPVSSSEPHDERGMRGNKRKRNEGKHGWSSEDEGGSMGKGNRLGLGKAGGGGLGKAGEGVI